MITKCQKCKKENPESKYSCLCPKCKTLWVEYYYAHKDMNKKDIPSPQSLISFLWDKWIKEEGKVKVQFT